MATKPENAELLQRMRREAYQLHPPSAFRKEILACTSDDTIPAKEKPEAMRKIMDKHGFDKLTLDDLAAAFRFRAPGVVVKPLPAEPIVTKPVDDKDPELFGLSEFAAVYNVTSKDPPCRVLSVKEVSDGEKNEITLVNQAQRTVFIPKQEISEDKQHEFVLWSNDDASYKVEFYSQFDDKQNRLLRYFDGWVTLKGKAPLKFAGTEIPANKDHGEAFIEKYGIHCLVGTVIFLALGGYIFTKIKEKAARDQDVARQEKAIEMQTATLAQQTQHVHETRAMAEADAARNFLESTAPEKRQDLLDSIDKGLQEAFEDYKSKIPENRKGIEFRLDYKEADKDLREAYDKVIRDKIATFVKTDAHHPGSAALQLLVNEGVCKAGDKQAREDRIEAEAVSSVAQSMLGKYGSYKDLIDTHLARIEETYKIEVIDSGISTLATEISNRTGRVDGLERNVTKAKKWLADRTKEYETLHKGMNPKDRPLFEQKWETKKKQLETDVENEVKKRNENMGELTKRRAERTAGEEKRKDAEKERTDAETKRKAREAHFRDHMKLKH